MLQQVGEYAVCTYDYVVLINWVMRTRLRDDDHMDCEFKNKPITRQK